MKNTECKLTDEQLKLRNRLEYGNITKISKALGFSREHISLVLSGKRDRPCIWICTEQFIDERDAKIVINISNINKCK